MNKYRKPISQFKEIREATETTMKPKINLTTEHLHETGEGRIADLDRKINMFNEFITRSSVSKFAQKLLFCQ